MATRPDERRRAALVSLALVVAVALPGVRVLLDPDAGDGFPLSTYPMFNRDPGSVIELPTVVVVTADGVERLSPELIAGTDQVIQAWEAVRAAVAGGPGAVAALCDEVAGRVEPPASLEVVVERYDVVEWSSDPGMEPRERRRLARCRAPG